MGLAGDWQESGRRWIEWAEMGLKWKWTVAKTLLHLDVAEGLFVG